MSDENNQNSEGTNHSGETNQENGPQTPEESTENFTPQGPPQNPMQNQEQNPAQQPPAPDANVGQTMQPSDQPGWGAPSASGQPPQQMPPAGQPPQFNQQPTQQPPVGGPKMQASPADRAKAYLLDILLSIVTCGIGWLIWYLIVAGEGYSPAKKIMNLQVIDTKTGYPLGLGKMLLRDWILKSIIMNACFVLGFWMFWDDESNELWDKIMNTTVVYDS